MIIRKQMMKVSIDFVILLSNILHNCFPQQILFMIVVMVELAVLLVVMEVLMVLPVVAFFLDLDFVLFFVWPLFDDELFAADGFGEVEFVVVTAAVLILCRLRWVFDLVFTICVI